MRKIHGVNLSPFVRKARVALIEKGLDYELVPVFPGSADPEFRKISPLGKVPTYEEDGWTIPDSSVIIAYLERVHPQPALYPADPKDLAKALFLEEYADTKLLEATVPFFVQRVVNPKFLNQESDESAIEAAIAAQDEIFGYLEGQIRDGAALVGGRFSVADIAVCTQFATMAHGGGTIDAARWPGLASYVATILARPSFKAVIEEEKAGIPS